MEAAACSSSASSSACDADATAACRSAEAAWRAVSSSCCFIRRRSSVSSASAVCAASPAARRSDTRASWRPCHSSGGTDATSPRSCSAGMASPVVAQFRIGAVALQFAARAGLGQSQPRFGGLDCIDTDLGQDRGADGSRLIQREAGTCGGRLCRCVALVGQQVLLLLQFFLSRQASRQVAGDIERVASRTGEPARRPSRTD